MPGNYFFSGHFYFNVCFYALIFDGLPSIPGIESNARNGEGTAIYQRGIVIDFNQYTHGGTYDGT
ncbi:hypothetical protein KTO58_22855 [Chitinophaga pendula]|uniref:hypothetical protein n=1 Tax=Chitinophaga TaxID=79328 RepID=UPI000BAF7016|nr:MULTISPECIES: hypothetical protein [Chitinophaga]ASZ10546.1 hypothetical protein CK934_05920 [Chitinophaga sp. MD30]UCJ06481.1 hypothetical protein KTO58_22855 [Chitinophaga pendula]